MDVPTTGAGGTGETTGFCGRSGSYDRNGGSGGDADCGCCCPSYCPSCKGGHGGATP